MCGLWPRQSVDPDLQDFLRTRILFRDEICGRGLMRILLSDEGIIKFKILIKFKNR